jgi:hypothetical protein
MTLAVSPWTGNDHEVGQQFADDSLDLFVGGFAKDTGEDRMRHLYLNAFCRHSIGSHCLEGTRSAKGRHLVCSDDHTDDANEKGTGCSVPVLRMCGNVGNGHAADYRNGAFDCWFGSKFEVDFHMGMR